MNQHAEDLRKCCDALQAEIERLRSEIDRSQLKTLVDIRWAVGDNGKRMQDELVEYIREIVAERDALRARIEAAPVAWLHRSVVLGDTSVHLCDYGGDSIDVSAFDDRQVRLVVEEG